VDNFSTDTWNRLNIEAKPLVPRSCHLFYRCEPQKKEKFYFTNLHSYHMLWFCLSGEGCVNIENTPYILKEGEAIILSPEQAHFRTPYEDKHIQWLIVRFELDCDSQWLNLMRNQIFNYKGRVEQLLHEFRKACESYHDNGSCSADECQLRIALLLDAIHTVAVTRNISSGGEPENMVKQLCRQILKRASGSKTLAEIAKENGVSAGYLRALVKKEIGRPPRKVKNEEILRRAEIMLTHSTLSISEIADRLEFSSIYAFSRFFKKHRNVSPSEFRVKPEWE